MDSTVQFIQEVEKIGVAVERDKHGFGILNNDLSFPFLIITVCTKGNARALYDMRECAQQKNDLGLVLPGHILRPLECSEDYTFTRLAISPMMLEGLRGYLFSHDYAKFHYNPVCSLTDTQVERLLTIVDQLAVIATHTEFDLNHRNHILLAQLSVGYEYLNYYRREQDQLLAQDSRSALFAQFCDLVVAHFREHRDIQFYARQMNYHPKYMSRVIRSVTNGVTPKEWIEQFVVAQAKRLIESNPKQSLKHISMLLGFSDHSSFYRYFKRVTGLYPQAYKEMF